MHDAGNAGGKDAQDEDSEAPPGQSRSPISNRRNEKGLPARVPLAGQSVSAAKGRNGERDRDSEKVVSAVAASLSGVNRSEAAGHFQFADNAGHLKSRCSEIEEPVRDRDRKFAIKVLADAERNGGIVQQARKGELDNPRTQVSQSNIAKRVQDGAASR